MSERDILNPKPGYDPDIGDSMNPSYNFSIERPSTSATSKAAGGAPRGREVENGGHVLSLSWIGRTRACVRRLKRFQEQFEYGYFTFIDHEGGGRHYVGRFTSSVKASPTSNNKYDVQNVTFEEVPTAPMLKYPTEWEADGVTFDVVNDYGDQIVATGGTWNQNLREAGTDDEAELITLDNAGTAGEWACFEYRGYGFRLNLMKGPAFGQAKVFVDAVEVATIDCYDADEVGSSIVLCQEAMPLDLHRVKVVCLGSKNAAATSPAIAWHSLEVMR